VNVDVAACIVRAADGRVLVAERTARQLAAGYWELPGGKIDAGETAQQAAARELLEEVGLDARSLRPALRYVHDFKSKRICVSFFFVDEWTGSPHGREGQRIAWIDPASPSVGPLLPSNARMLMVLGLPAQYVRVDRDTAEVPRGARLILVDDPSLAPDQRIALARRAGAAAESGAHVIVAGSALEMHRSGASGVHTRSKELHAFAQRPPVPLWSVACEDEGAFLRAVALGADIVLLPASYQHAASSAARVPVPVYQEDGTGSAIRMK
jgi:8-oxo-dGTP diphosphatase